MVAFAEARNPGAARPEGDADPVQVLAYPARVRAALSPLRRRLLRELRDPGSASSLAPRLELSRQKLNYHLRVLEDLGLVRLVELRQRRGCQERILQTSARTLVVAPEVLGDVGIGAGERQDRYSSAHLIATAARLIGDVAALREEAREAGKRLATVTQETEIHFRSPAEMRAFTDRLSAAIAGLVAEYHAPDDSAARPYRLTLGMHPRRDSEGARPSNAGEGE